MDYETHKIALLVGFAIFLVLNVFDVITTFIGIAFDHLSEQNPIGAYLFVKLGLVPGMILLKTIYFVLIGGTLYALLRDVHSFVADDVMIIGMMALNILGFFVLSNNFGLLGWPYFFQFRF